MKRRILLTLITLALVSVINAQPTPPANLKATTGGPGIFTFVKLDWSPSTGATSATIYYNIYKKEGAKSDTGTYKKLKHITRMNSFFDKNVSFDTTYSYYVTASYGQQAAESKASDTVEIKLSTQNPGFVSGTITNGSSNVPVGNVRIAFIPIAGTHLELVRSDSTGHFFAKLAPGNYFVHFTAKQYRSQFYNNAETFSKATQLSVAADDTTKLTTTLIQKAPAAIFTLSGKVTDSLGAPVKADIKVFVLEHKFFTPHVLHAKTDSLGAYNLRVRESDSLIIYAQPLDHKYAATFYNNQKDFASADRIVVKENRTDINFVLGFQQTYKNSISGKISSSADSSVGIIANVTAFRLSDNFLHGRYRTSVMTDSLGNYTLNNLLPGQYLLFALPAQGYLPTFYQASGISTLKWKEADSIDVKATSVITGYNFNLQASSDTGFCTIAGIVKDNKDIPVSGVLVFVLDENQNVVGYTITEPSGGYSVTGLAPGNYTVTTDMVSFTGSTATNVLVSYSDPNAQSQNVPLTLTPEEATSVEESAVISSYSLSQNYPNPFNPSTSIKYQIPEAGWVTLKVYNVIGQEVATLVNEVRAAGSYNVTFDASHLTSGVYLYKLNAGNKTFTHKMMLLK